MKKEPKIADSDLIVASGIVLVGLAAFYALYLTGRFVGAMIFA